MKKIGRLIENLPQSNAQSYAQRFLERTQKSLELSICYQSDFQSIVSL
jgi:hypothetical protein